MVPCLMDKDKVVGYKIKIFPNEQQKMRLNQIANDAISSYNWAIETIINRYNETNLFSNDMDLYRLYQPLIYNPPYEWIKRLPVQIARQSFSLAERSFRMYFKKVNRFPRFKSHKISIKKFHFRGTRLYFKTKDTITIEGMGRGLQNRIYCKDNSFIPKGPNIRYYNCTITKDSVGQYWFSTNIGYKTPITVKAQGEPIGIDLGVRKRVVLSDGTVYKSPDTKRLKKKARRLSIQYGKDRRRRLDLSQCTGEKYKDIPKTKNEIKREIAYRKVIKKISNINKTYNHTITRQIVDKNPSKIVIESLDVRGLIRDSKNKHVVGAIRDANFYDLIKMLEYKAEDRGIEIVRAGPYFPSSQICSRCGKKHKPGSHEVYVCPYCGLRIDRDLNAAINLRNLV